MNFIFDLGAVLFHWNPKEIAILACNPELAFLPHTPEWRSHDEGKISFDELSALHPGKVRSFMSATMEYLAPIPEGWELLRAAQKKGHPCYILSNLPQILHESLLDRYPYLEEIPGIYSYQVKCVKPDPQIFHHLFSRYNLDPSSSLFIDDLEPNITMARSLGLKSFLCQNHESVKKELLTLGYLE
jgi:HAD superfamily hydrolase (TIGR01509 family)